MMAKKVLMIVGTELCNAGVPGCVMALVRQLHGQYIFDVLCLSEKKGYHDSEFQSYGGQLFRMQPINYEDHKILYPYSAAQIGKKLQEILTTERYHAVHCHCGLDNGICLAVAKKMGVQNRISHAHGIYLRKGKNLLLRLYDCCRKHLIVQNSTVRLACSEQAGQSLYLRASFQNVLNPIDIDYYSGIVKVPHSGVNLLQIGYFNNNKNQKFSIRLTKNLREHGVDTKLLLIGYPADESYYSQMKAQIDQYNLQEVVQFLSHDEDKRKAFSVADYSLLPSNFEGLPLVALEAQAAGVICIASNHVPRDADHGGMIFANYNDIESWTDLIMQERKIDPDVVREKLNPLALECFARRIGEFYDI